MRASLFGRHLPPQRLLEAINTSAISSMREDPAMRLAETTSRPGRTYTGGDLVVQHFLRPPAGPNDELSLELAPVQINARRAINRTRGRVTDVIAP